MRVGGVNVENEDTASKPEGKLSGQTWRDDIIGGNYSGKDFSGVTFTSIDISGADFSNANLSGAKFASVDFSSVNFQNADLSFGKVASGDLDDVNMRGACLLNAKIVSSDFRGGEASRQVVFSLVEGSCHHL